MEKAQLVLPLSWTWDTFITKFSGLPQPLGALSVGTYVKQQNPGIVVEMLYTG